MIRRTVSRRISGVELVRATFFVAEEAQSALGDLVATAEAWMDRVLVPRAQNAYEEDASADKRFTFRRFEYALTASVVAAADGEKELILTATLGRARGELLEKSERRLRLSAQDGGFLPPKKEKASARRLLP